MDGALPRVTKRGILLRRAISFDPRLGLSSLVAASISACSVASDHRSSPSDSAPGASIEASASAAPSAAESASPPVDPKATDPMALHLESTSDLLALVTVAQPVPSRFADPDAFLAKTFGVSGPGTTNQGNKAIARHSVSRQKCLAGLEGTTLQTDDQRRICGADYMVPIYKNGDPTLADACIDIFEFPDRPCELPFVWIGPTQAKAVCELEGKRLCKQEEWMFACAGDPAGGPEQKYSYGNDLDLEACNTSKSPREWGGGCNPSSPTTAWSTCPTSTEPSGAFPRCRSRFGVYDLQGNVAEIMTRLDFDGEVKSQLKGSAWFYTDIARDEFGRAPNGRPPLKPEQLRGTYPDVCRHDPRWHVEPIVNASHVNYHLGFRCCKDVAK
jgi:sulfatase modifying factor 1